MKGMTLVRCSSISSEKKLEDEKKKALELGLGLGLVEDEKNKSEVKNTDKNKRRKRSKLYYLPHFLLVKQVQNKLKKKKKLNLSKAEDDERRLIPTPSIKRTKVIHRTTTTTTTTRTTITTPFVEDDKKRKISVLISASGADRTVYWFKTDPNKASKYIKDLTPVWSMPNCVPYEFVAVVLDSKLYVIGGFNDEIQPSSKVFVLDIGKDDPTWEECCDMISPRIHPAVAAIDGRIYVVGCSRWPSKDHCDPYIEIYDTAKNTWTPLSLPPLLRSQLPYLDVQLSTFSQEQGKLYIPSDSDQMYCFDARTRSWTTIPVPQQTFLHIKEGSVVVGDIIFTFDRNQLYALDLSQTTTLSMEIVHGLEEETASIDPGVIEPAHLLYLGEGKMCLIWDYITRESNKHKQMFVQCLKFWVGTPERGSCLRAVVDRADEYLVDGHFVHAVASLCEG